METALLLEKLEKFDSGTVANVVAGYPSRTKYCLKLYDAWGNYYTSSSVRNLFPQLGARVGYAVTCIMGEARDGDSLSMNDVLRAIDESPKPVICVMKSVMSEEYSRRAAIFGGNVATAFRQMGAVGYITDGQIRDGAEIEALGFPCIAQGVTPGHGDICIKAIQVEVNIAGMNVKPGEVIHMDESGAVKFPAEYTKEIYERATLLAEYETDYQRRMKAAADIEALIEVRSRK